MSTQFVVDRVVTHKRTYSLHNTGQIFRLVFIPMVDYNILMLLCCSRSGDWRAGISPVIKQHSESWISESMSWLVDFMYCSGSSLGWAFANLVLCSCRSSSSHSGSSVSSSCCLQDSYKTDKESKLVMKIVLCIWNLETISQLLIIFTKIRCLIKLLLNLLGKAMTALAMVSQYLMVPSEESHCSRSKMASLLA